MPQFPLLVKTWKIKKVANTWVLKLTKKKNLNMQTVKVCTKIAKFNGVLYRGRSCFSKQALIKFYIAYVIPLISYGLLAYGCTSKSNLDKIFLAQKKIIRTIFFLGKYDHVSEYFSKFQLQSAHEIFISHLFSETIFQFLGKSPLKFLNLDYLKTRRSTRSNSLGCIPLPLRKSKLLQNSVSYKIVKCYNFLMSNKLLPLNLNEFTDKQKKDFYVKFKKSVLK